MSCCCTPTYKLPNFNLAVDIWRGANPTTNPPDVSTTGQLTPGQLVIQASLPGGGGGFNTVTMFLKLPKLTDIRSTNGGMADVCEVPSGSGRFYNVTFVDDVSKGFATEFRLAILIQQAGWTPPYP